MSTAHKFKFDFAVAINVTEYAKKHFAHYKYYHSIYVCLDTWDYHILRILEGYNADYEKEEGSILVEHEKIEKPYKAAGLDMKILHDVLDQDSGLESWSVEQVFDIADAVDMIDGGFGVN